MARPWIRLYTELRHNSKLQRLPDHLFKFVINCWTATADNDDWLPPTSDLAWDLRIDEKLCQSYIDHLISQRVFDVTEGGKVIPHNWLDRQFLSDVSTDRVRKFRQRHMKPPAKRRGNVSETAQDSDTDTDSEQIQGQNACAEAHRRELQKSEGVGQVLTELEDLYLRAGVPVPVKHQHLALQLLLSIGPEKVSHVPRYVRHMLDSGRWSSAKTTKGLLNLLRDGDWDVPIVERSIPPPVNGTGRRRHAIDEMLEELRQEREN